MSLVEFPLYPIDIASVKVGFDSDNGLTVLFPTRDSFFLDVHDERSAGVEAVEGGRTGEPGG